MGPPDSRLNRKVMPGKNLAVDIVHLFRPNTRRTLRKLSTIVDRGNRVARGRHRADANSSLQQLTRSLSLPDTGQ